MRTSGNKAKNRRKKNKNETTTIIHTIESYSERKKEFQVNIYTIKPFWFKRMHQWLLSFSVSKTYTYEREPTYFDRHIFFTWNVKCEMWCKGCTRLICFWIIDFFRALRLHVKIFSQKKNQFEYYSVLFVNVKLKMYAIQVAEEIETI